MWRLRNLFLLLFFSIILGCSLARTTVINNTINEDIGIIQSSYDDIFNGNKGRMKREAPLLLERFPGRAVTPGSSISLWCGARGPVTRISWNRDNSPLQAVTTPRSPVDQIIRSYVNISRIQPEEAGMYTCTVQGSDGQTYDSHAARIDVYGPPYIRPMNPVKALVKTRVTVHCPYYGYPVSKIQWEHNGNIVSTDLNITPRYRRNLQRNIKFYERFLNISNENKKSRSKRSFVTNEEGMLIINEVDAEESAGFYTCSVSNPSGENARRAFELIVMEPPILEDLSFPTNLHEGEIAQATCSIRSGDTPIFFTWLKDGSPISARLKIEERSSELFSVLLIKKVKLQHCGTYTCIAANHAARVNKSADLFIKVAPKWLVEPNNSSVVVGQMGQIACAANGYPQPQTYWMKKDDNSGSWQPVLELRGTGLLSLPNGTLVMEVVSVKDQGEYSCRVENGVGQPLSKSIWITVNKPVTFETKSLNITTRIGSQATITCEVSGDHPIRITWTHKGRILENSHRIKINNLQSNQGALSEIFLGSATLDDAGEYTCKASNAHGNGHFLANLNVQEPPSPPLYFAVEGVWSRKAKMEWRPPSGPLALGYMLQYFQQNTAVLTHPNWAMATSVNITAISGEQRQRVEVTGLQPASLYMARLCTIGESDLSPFTAPLLFTTLEEEPSSPPIEVQVETGEQPGELLVSWMPPPSHTFNGILLGYIIIATPQINEHSEENTRVVKVNSMEAMEIPSIMNGDSNRNSLRTNLRGLLKSTRYSVTVSCFNSAGNGPSSPHVYRTTREGAPEIAPDRISCSAMSSTSLRISWRPLPLHLQGGAMLGYVITYTTIDGLEQNITTMHSTTYMEGLQKYTNYSISIAGYCSFGIGPISSTVFCATLEDLPGPPLDLKAMVTTSTSLTIGWLPPLQPNGKLLHYTMYMKPSSGNGNIQSYRVLVENGDTYPYLLGSMTASSVGGLSYSIRSLSLGKRFDIWVTATTAVGEGESSRTVTAHTQERVSAGVVSLGGKVLFSAGTSPRLWCNAVGSPQPRVVWYHNNKVITHHLSFSLNSDDSLLIHNIENSLEGNYTCMAKNLFGTDSVTYIVGVMYPPSPPTLRVVPSSHSLTVHWSPSHQSNSYNKSLGIIGYTLKWRETSTPTNNNWESLDLMGGTEGNRQIAGLRCGAEFEVQIYAKSRAGSSAPGHTIIHTPGSIMTPPNGIDWIWRNSTHMTLETDSWIDGHCGSPIWTLHYRPLRSSHWQQADISEHPKLLTIKNLQPAKWYQIRLTATNQAGPSSALYNVPTKTIAGDDIGPPNELFDTSMLIMMCSCILLLLCMIICIFAAVQKHRHKMLCGTSNSGAIYKQNGPPVVPRQENESQQCQRIYSSPVCTRKPTKSNTEMFEISPYAQFTMGFQTFGHNDNQDRPCFMKKPAVYSTDTSFQGCSESDDSDSISKTTTIPKPPNKMCKVQYHR